VSGPDLLRQLLPLLILGPHSIQQPYEFIVGESWKTCDEVVEPARTMRSWYAGHA
jgi:hypothetical protein